MKIIIDIPKEFINEYNNDRFQSSLERLKIGARLLAGRYEKEVVDMLIRAFQYAEIVQPEQRKICSIGDEVVIDGTRTVIISLKEVILYYNGDFYEKYVGIDEVTNDTLVLFNTRNYDIRKTGRHFDGDEIEKKLKAIEERRKK